MKAVPLSQTEGQKILTAILGAFPGLLEQAKEAPEEMLGLGAPGFDLAGIRHETLYSPAVYVLMAEGNDIVWRKDETVCPM